MEEEMTKKSTIDVNPEAGIDEDLELKTKSSLIKATPENRSMEPQARLSSTYKWRARWRSRVWAMTVASRQPMKRSLDILGSLILIILFSPFFVLIYLAIKVEDRGPAIFTQTRVGKWGRPFRFHKFRSMVVNAEHLKEKLKHLNEMKGVTFKMKNDPRVTKVGRIIRRFSLDELPQLWCVLRGDMSLVGPRPPLPNEVAQYMNHHRYRLDGTPGLTCIWQVTGRNEIHFEDQVKLDVQYIHKRTLWEDIKILFKTVYAMISARGAS